jgi:transposase
MPSEKAVYVAIELGLTSWLVGGHTRAEHREAEIASPGGGDAAALLKTIGDLRSNASAKLGCAIDVACCFEAGRDGFWLHRLLTAHGIAAYVLEPTSIPMN